MTIAGYIFWACLTLVVYTYLLYPWLLFVAYSVAQSWRDLRYLVNRRSRRARAPASDQWPAVSLVVPAYNEEAALAQKLANLAQLDYPREKLEFIFISDGSTDRTSDILQAWSEPSMRAIFLPERQGKFNALNRGVAEARHGLLVFSDATTLFAADAVKNLARHFDDPRVGVVCGAVRLEGSPESRQTEGLYWKYESALRLMESRLGATLYASGCIYAVRRECYSQLKPGDLIDDFIVPNHARRLGYRVLDDPEAVATEFSAASVEGEFVRRVRLAAGGFRALKTVVRAPWFNFTGVAFVSHKLLRWILPFLLIGLLASSSVLWTRPFYRAALIAQLCFYAWAALGFLFRRQVGGVRYALLGYFLVAIHLAFLVGFWRGLFGRADSAWQRVQ